MTYYLLNLKFFVKFKVDVSAYNIPAENCLTLPRLRCNKDVPLASKNQIITPATTAKDTTKVMRAPTLKDNMAFETVKGANVCLTSKEYPGEERAGMKYDDPPALMCIEVGEIWAYG